MLSVGCDTRHAVSMSCIADMAYGTKFFRAGTDDAGSQSRGPGTD